MKRRNYLDGVKDRILIRMSLGGDRGMGRTRVCS